MQFSNDNSHLLGVLYIFWLGDSKGHFDFAVYEVSELEHIMNSLCN